jgi:hypothetical protein
MSKKTKVTLALLFAWTLLMVSSVAITAYASDEQKAENALTPSSAPHRMKNATPAGSALLPSKPSKVVERSPVEPLHNPAGSEMYVAPLTIPVTCDGSIDAAEWADAYMYDVSDTSGQQDAPDPLGTVFLWLKQDENGIYFAIRNNADAVLDQYDQCGLYFDDNHDGCWPPSATNEGNNWLVYDAAGNFVAWRWWQDFDCQYPPNYVCTYDNVLYAYDWSPACFGIGIGPTGVVDYEVMIPYGAVDEHLDLTMPPESLGFYMYSMDNGIGSWNGEWPSQGYATTFREPCYFGRLICGEVEEWPNHKMHFPQEPDLEGWDVYAVAPKTLADDWQCSETGWITDIHFWGSWKDIDGDPYTDDFYTPMPWFGLSIHRNIPADPETPWSRPGEMLWWWDGEIEGTPFEPPAMEHWFNPNTGEVLYNDHVPYWRYDFFVEQAYPPADSFYQYKDSIYWLNIAVHPDHSPPPYGWGWKSSRDHFMDDATYTDTPPDGPWFPLYEPPRANWFNVYFDAEGFPYDEGSTNYYGQGWYRYEYWWNMWFYNNPFVHQPKHIWLEFFIDPVGPYPYAEFAINWSTDLWYYEGVPGRPPLPGDDETLFIGREVFPVGPGPNTIDFWIDDYNPEWVSIDFVATDVVINGWIWHECVQTSMDLAFVITGHDGVPEESLYWKPDHEDYAPSGMPDIDQKQDNWYKYDTGAWTFCGPVAVANCFKWFDAKYNDVAPGAPCDGWDQFPLVRDYTDATPPIWCPAPGNMDDHSAENIDHPATPWLFGATPPPPPTPQPFVPGAQPQPSGMPAWGELVERLAWYFDTDGVRTGYCAFSGTYVDDMQDGIDQWFIDEGVDDILYERTWPQPTFAWVETLVEKCQDVILLLGFWYEVSPGEWYREGGHYVTVAGVNSELGLIAFSDPYYDNAEAGGRGRVRNGIIIPHAGHPAGTSTHNDEGNVSHDIYDVIEPSPSPGGLWALAGYPPGGKSSLSEWMSNFYNQNVPDEFKFLTAPRDGKQQIHTEVEYAVEISPWEYPPDCGDINCDGVVDIGDVVYLVSWLFIGGPPPCKMVKADVNHDGYYAPLVNIADVVYMVTYLFQNGPLPQCYDP